MIRFKSIVAQILDSVSYGVFMIPTVFYIALASNIYFNILPPNRVVQLEKLYVGSVSNEHISILGLIGFCSIILSYLVDHIAAVKERLQSETPSLKMMVFLKFSVSYTQYLLLFMFATSEFVPETLNNLKSLVVLAGVVLLFKRTARKPTMAK
jgi:hypothetical protein